MRITRFGHAALLVETDSTRLLIDPGGFCGDDVFALTDLDGIVVTHQHPDHLDRERAQQLFSANPSAYCIADPQTAEQVEGPAWTENADGVITEIGDLSIRGVGAQHAVILPEIERIANVGVLVSAGDGQQLFHPGDTYEYAPPGVDLLALPLGAPWAKLSETVEFVQRVEPGALLPIHDLTISELAYPLYWNQVEAHGGCDDCRPLGQSDSTDLD